MKYPRRTVLVVAALLAASVLPAFAKSKKKELPAPDPKTGIAVDWKWAPTLQSGTAWVEGKAFNLSGKEYKSVSLTFGVWAKDGDKMGEGTAYIGAMPDGTKATFFEYVRWNVNGDKPDTARLLSITAF